MKTRKKNKKTMPCPANDRRIPDLQDIKTFPDYVSDVVLVPIGKNPKRDKEIMQGWKSYP